MRLMSSVSLLVIAMAGPCLHGIAHAGESEDADKPPRHDEKRLEEIVVSAHPGGRTRFEVLQGTSVLGGEELERALSATIGATLDALPGLSQTAFGQGASRPIIRGLGGDRLRVLINDLGSFDVSTTSPDHAVAIDPASARRIEVVRGPATLVYGANAIAGVVNVTDDRVPRAEPEDGIEGFARSIYGSNADDTLNGGALTASLGAGLVAHLDGFFRDSNDFKAAGFLRSPALRAAEPLDPGDAEPAGRAENSDIRSWGTTGGLSHVDDRGFIGASVSVLNTNYGIPVELEGEEEEGSGGGDGVRIDIEQIRFDVIGERSFGSGPVELAKLRFGYGDYDQAELEGGDVGTLFRNREWEGRIDLVQKTRGSWSGNSGLSLRSRKFSAIGAEAFVPRNDIFQWGLFSFQSYETGPWHFDAGLRFDHQSVEASELGLNRGFTGISVSGGASYRLASDWLIGINGFRTERAPNAEELFSDGPHLATFTFERGDPTLGEETVKGFDASLKKTGGRLSFALNAYYYDYSDFIFERFTGEEEDGLRVAAFAPADARFYGFEAEAEYELWSDGERSFGIDLVFDTVKARQSDGGEALPRIPPRSLTLAADWQGRLFDLRVASEFAGRQRDLGAFELPTGSYVNLTASLVVHPFPARDIDLILEARNLADEDIRYHTSFLKDLLPAPGRDIRLTLKAGF
ncbi:MAG: TonB-dependent receptor [Rhodothalassiaceae bacterium]